MIIKQMRCYFLYNVPVTEHLIVAQDGQTIGASQPFIDRFRQHFVVEEAEVPAFYTEHYRRQHTPYSIKDPAAATRTRISQEALAAIGFYQELNLTQDIVLDWEFRIALQNIGLVTLKLTVEEPLPSNLAYRLSGLHLNPAYQVIDTGPIEHLWSYEAASRPALVTLDELARAIHHHYFLAAGLTPRRFRALRHEIQMPLTAIDVETDCATQREFVEQERRDLAEMVFKPACWEVEHASLSHAEHVLQDERVWSVARDTLVVVAYEGALYVKIKTFDTGVPHEVSGFRLADEASILHSFRVAVSNYHFLRILDDLLDREIEELTARVHTYQVALRRPFEGTPSAGDNHLLQEMNDFVVQVTDLRFELVNLLEEIDNSDKFIDEEWHIVLLDKLNLALGAKPWRDNLRNRIDNLRALAEVVEDTYEKLLNLRINQSVVDVNSRLLQLNEETQQAEERLKLVQYIFGTLAAAELLGLLCQISAVRQLPVLRLLNLELYAAVFSILGVIFVFIVWWERRNRPG
ncbi:MAG: hypothetical protein L0332_25280 [Chloroflexi bacterium]|nr:hypothetical protein [Chloroflexota bacterium]MCI0579029.1 hypothetical protein [Chloroflexota bacterium]MCI0646956.1 hypothetical protein [Chloroflexota bacterium]MCI0730010.1 hypothetical protein [Chloroflexota bacterium]